MIPGAVIVSDRTGLFNQIYKLAILNIVRFVRKSITNIKTERRFILGGFCLRRRRIYLYPLRYKWFIKPSLVKGGFCDDRQDYSR